MRKLRRSVAASRGKLDAVTIATVLVALSCAYARSASAKLSPKWVEAPAHAPNVRMLIHESSGQAKSPASFVAVQVHSASEPKVKRLFDSLQATQKPVPELAPNRCYRLRRAGLATKQTWCLASGGRATVFVEQGPVYMSENELTDFELGTLTPREAK